VGSVIIGEYPEEEIKMQGTPNYLDEMARRLMGFGRVNQNPNPMQKAFSMSRPFLTGMSNMSMGQPAQGLNQGQPAQGFNQGQPTQGFNQGQPAPGSGHDPLGGWPQFKPGTPTQSGIYNNDWQSQVWRDKNRGDAISFKNYEGDIYYEGGPGGVGGTYNPQFYGKQLQNDMKALQEDLAGTKDAWGKLQKIYEETKDPDLEAYGKPPNSDYHDTYLTWMQNEYNKTLQGETQTWRPDYQGGYQGFSPYQRLTFNNPKYGIVYGMPSYPGTGK
jgi:hypothetical protein